MYKRESCSDVLRILKFKFRLSLLRSFFFLELVNVRFRRTLDPLQLREDRARPAGRIEPGSIIGKETNEA